uniref:Uncharacterized protein n=1 Tax=Timema cristinae TaxID=61476 RepID=A0A7R9CEL7_TIMCR|nr:unnamed protein product [Timema cristinae]
MQVKLITTSRCIWQIIVLSPRSQDKESCVPVTSNQQDDIKDVFYISDNILCVFHASKEITLPQITRRLESIKGSFTLAKCSPVVGDASWRERCRVWSKKGTPLEEER